MQYPAFWCSFSKIGINYLIAWLWMRTHVMHLLNHGCWSRNYERQCRHWWEIRTCMETVSPQCLYTILSRIFYINSRDYFLTSLSNRPSSAIETIYRYTLSHLTYVATRIFRPLPLPPHAARSWQLRVVQMWRNAVGKPTFYGSGCRSTPSILTFHIWAPSTWNVIEFWSQAKCSPFECQLKLFQKIYRGQ